MITLTGKSVFGGVAIGKIAFYKRNEITIKRIHVDDTEGEVKRFETAKEKAVPSFRNYMIRRWRTWANPMHDIRDPSDDAGGPGLCRVYRKYHYHSGSECRICHWHHADNFAAMFQAMDDAYMQGRAADVKDVSERLLQVLSDNSTDAMKMDEPAIIAADDLVPSETVQLDKEKVLSFITMHGSAIHILPFLQGR